MKYSDKGESKAHEKAESKSKEKKEHGKSPFAPLKGKENKEPKRFSPLKKQGKKVDGKGLLQKAMGKIAKK